MLDHDSDTSIIFSTVNKVNTVWPDIRNSLNPHNTD